MGHTEVSPKELRFTQSSIKNTFKPPYDSLLVGDVADRIRSNLLSPTDFSPMNVVDYENRLWSLDNRRLWVFRHAGVPRVKVNLVSPNHHNRSTIFFQTVGPRIRTSRYYKPSYLPEVRGPLRMSDGGQSSIISPPPPPPSVPPPPQENWGEESRYFKPSYLPDVRGPLRMSDNGQSSIISISEQPRTILPQKIDPNFTAASAAPPPRKNWGEGDKHKKAKSLGRKLFDALVFGLKKSFQWLGFIVRHGFVFCLAAMAVLVYGLVIVLKKSSGFLWLIVRHGFVVCLIALAVYCVILGITKLPILGLVNQLGDVFGGLWRGLMEGMNKVEDIFGGLWRGLMDGSTKIPSAEHVKGEILSALRLRGF